ncbi:hypothetical protein [Prochlorococcus marinus]|uniref:Uncharacterized protein n=1 Tax=Prochlorococcus marinus (strain MIT 9211) TaxID=93059 RepID=A9B9P0_PROM4|nr:hypothetical protein [Prochlorococcus marinus]ABX08552.1 Hypothetical protein P9211_06211 [Prochlorococcus marinus str. MIT 9211]
MTKNDFALKISLAMHKDPSTPCESFHAYLNTYKCLSHYFKELSIEDIEGIASRYGVMS